MENQREICLAEFNKSRIENTPMNWYIWKRAYDRGAANEATYYSDIQNVSESILCQDCFKSVGKGDNWCKYCGEVIV